MSHFRYCKLKDNWVIISKKRDKRPMEYNYNEADERTSNSSPFEHGREDKTPPEILAIRPEGSRPNSPGWKVRVVPNKYNALDIEKEPLAEVEGFFEKFSGFGAHEVIIDTPEGSKSAYEFDENELMMLFKAARDRISDLSKDMRLGYVLVFKNHGKKAGASIKHSHTQILATPFIPKNIQTELEQCREYFFRHGRTLLTDEIKEELRLKKRIVYENEHFIAYCPYASNFTFEIRVAPKKQLAYFNYLQDYELHELSECIQRSIAALGRSLEEPSFNMAIKTAPPARDHKDPNYFYKVNEFFHWYIEIMPRLFQLGGFEIASGYYINPVAPEEAATFLQSVL